MNKGVIYLVILVIIVVVVVVLTGKKKEAVQQAPKPGAPAAQQQQQQQQYMLNYKSMADGLTKSYNVPPAPGVTIDMITAVYKGMTIKDTGKVAKVDKPTGSYPSVLLDMDSDGKAEVTVNLPSAAEPPVVQGDSATFRGTVTSWQFALGTKLTVVVAGTIEKAGP